MVDLFYMLAGFEDEVYIHETTKDNVTTREVRGMSHALKQDLGLAVASIIYIFCEALRLRSVTMLHTPHFNGLTTQPLSTLGCGTCSTHGGNFPTKC